MSAEATSRKLADRVVLVTGAAGGLGAAVARAAGAAGATVVLLGRKVKPLEKLYDALREAGAPEPAIYPLDLEGATAADYDALAQAIERECGRLDAIVHAAARFDGLVAFEHCDPLDWLRGLHVNLAAPALLTRACLPLLRRADPAVVLFPLEDVARRAAWGAYGLAKSATGALVAQLADELEHSSVRVLGIRPGAMRTALRAKAYFAENPGAIPTPERAAAACVELIAAPARTGTLVDLAQTVAA